MNYNDCSNYLLLRDVVKEDLPLFFNFQQDEEANYLAAFTAKDPSDRVAFDDHWEKIMKMDSVVIKTILCAKEVVGSVLSYVQSGETEVSYWIGKEFWGNGIATKALKLFLEVQTVRPIFARVATDNPRSIRVLEKCGFKIIDTSKGFANARNQEIDEHTMRLEH